jgi:DNA-binding transcriptional regulator GbsR (MarR family)
MLAVMDGDRDRDTDPVDAAAFRVAEVVGGLMEFWGFKAVMGRLWAVLYLSPQPLAAAELAERLSLSSGGVSMALQELQKWGVVRKAWRPGERRDYYEPETSIWKMVSRVFRERELGKVREATEAFEAALKLVEKARGKAAAEEKRRLRFVEGRLTSLLRLSRVGEQLLGLLAAGSPIDPQPLKSLFERGG